MNVVAQVMQGIIFINMVERIGDHAVNIADGVLGEQGKFALKQTL